MKTTATIPDSVRSLFAQVTADTGIQSLTLLGHTSDGPVCKARQTLVGLIYQLTDITLHDIAGIFRRDVGTIYYSLDRVRARLMADPGYARQYARLLGKRPVTRKFRPASAKARSGPPAARPVRSHQSILATSTHGTLDQLRGDAVQAKLADAREQLAYWTMAKARSSRDQDRNEAAARILVWTGEVAACERRLRDFNDTADSTAPAAH
jgi:hypothetical protein